MKGRSAVLLSRPDRIGDVVLSTSCLRPVREQLLPTRLYLLVREPMLDLLEEHPGLDGAVPVPGVDPVGTLAERFHELRIDTLVHLNPHPDVQAAGERAGIEMRLGFGKPRDRSLTHCIENRKKQGLKLEAQYNFDLLERIGVEAPDRLEAWVHPRVSAKTAVEALDLPERFAAFHLGAHQDKPRISAPVLAEVARWLHDTRGLAAVVIGSREDEPASEEFAELVGRERVTDVCGQTGLAESAWLLARATIAIGRDSGPTHLAAAMGAATVTIFAEPNRVNSSRRWHPLGPRSVVVEHRLDQRWWESRARFARRASRHLWVEDITRAIDKVLDPD